MPLLSIYLSILRIFFDFSGVFILRYVLVYIPDIIYLSIYLSFHIYLSIYLFIYFVSFLGLFGCILFAVRVGLYPWHYLSIYLVSLVYPVVYLLQYVSVYLSECLRRGWTIFIIKGFRTIVFIFIVIFLMFQSICHPAVFRCLSNSEAYAELRITSFI